MNYDLQQAVIRLLQWATKPVAPEEKHRQEYIMLRMNGSSHMEALEILDSADRL